MERQTNTITTNLQSAANEPLVSWDIICKYDMDKDNQWKIPKMNTDTQILKKDEQILSMDNVS